MAWWQPLFGYEFLLIPVDPGFHFSIYGINQIISLISIFENLLGI